MDVMALRTWGIAVSAAAIASLVTFAVSACDRPPSQVEEQLPVAQGIAQVAQAPSDRDHEPASAARAAAPTSFVVRFQGNGPMARAQAQAAGGQQTAAQRAIEAQLARQAAFRGLCFDRFTVGAAEVVLRTCTAAPPPEQAQITARWLARLNAMPGVAYADANATVSQDRAQ
ncbi:hypothetical protein [Terricaulis sp.]|uniref:hypothetical protein n=1 Tax=Terricaulis sp. TaxID=2768686 RepID=UPI0037836C1E